MKAAVALAACLALGAGALPAQSNPAIRTAVQLAAEGRSDSAYRLVNSQLSQASAGDTTYVEALYWRARLATYGDSAERDLRRVAIEYPGSSWADDALLQLSQLALAGGNPASAFELAGRVRSDYPDSDLKPRAALWAARAAFEIGEPRIACAMLDTARTEGAADIEFVNQVLFYRGRCTSGMLAPAPRADSAAPPAREPAAAPPAAPAMPHGFEVQAAAANSDESARAIADRLTRAGLSPRIVRGEGNVRRVRLGPFETQAAADSVARVARRAVGGEPFVVRLP